MLIDINWYSCYVLLSSSFTMFVPCLPQLCNSLFCHSGFQTGRILWTEPACDRSPTHLRRYPNRTWAEASWQFYSRRRKRCHRGKTLGLEGFTGRNTARKMSRMSNEFKWHLLVGICAHQTTITHYHSQPQDRPDSLHTLFCNRSSESTSQSLTICKRNMLSGATTR